MPTQSSEDAGLLLFDANADGDLDLYATSDSPEFGTNELAEALCHRLYTNDGKGNFAPATNALPNFSLNGSCVKAADVDGDGELNLFVGGRVEPYKYLKGISSYLLRNDSKKGEPRFSDVTVQMAPALAKSGLTCDALWTGFDKDGDVDLLLASEWAPLMMLRNDKGHLQPVENNGLADKAGFWDLTIPGDFDNDGDTDWLAGNTGQNSLLRASTERPVRIYAGSFDNDGFYDAFPSVYFKNAEDQYEKYSYFGWEGTVKQMIGIKKRYLENAPFGQATMSQILTEEEGN